MALFLGILCTLIYLSKLGSIDEKKRILEDETEYFSAKMEDTKREITSTRVQLGRKRKRDECDWTDDGDRLVEESKRLVRRVGGWRSLLMGPKMRWDVNRLSYALKVHDKRGDLLLRQALSDARGLCRGFPIPVKELVGRVASETLDQLKLLLEGDQVGRIAIHGIEGIGKTFLMKHLHNYALCCFDYVFWVTSPSEFTIRSLQDAVAAAVNCEFDSDDDLFVRARKLSDRLANLGSFALFLDGVQKAEFSLQQAGILVPANGSKCRLVLTMNFPLDCRILDCFETVEVKRLSISDAYQLFMREANIGEGSVSSLDGIPSLLANWCCGVPRMIKYIATRLCSIDEPHEWRHARFELESLGLYKKPPLFHLEESETTSSTCKARLISNPNGIVLTETGSSDFC